MGWMNKCEEICLDRESYPSPASLVRCSSTELHVSRPTALVHLAQTTTFFPPYWVFAPKDTHDKHKFIPVGLIKYKCLYKEGHGTNHCNYKPAHHRPSVSAVAYKRNPPWISKEGWPMYETSTCEKNDKISLCKTCQ